VSNRVKGSKSSAQRVRAASQAGKGRSTNGLWIAAIVVVLVVGVVAIAVSRGSGSSGGGGASPSGGTVVPNGDLNIGKQIVVTGTDLPTLPKDAPVAAVDPAIGAAFPTIEGNQFDGKTLSIAPGKPMIVMGLAHWCGNCQKEVPQLQKWLDENGMPSDVNLYAVATGNSSAQQNYPASDWLRREKWSVPTIVDTSDNIAARAMGLNAYPFFVVVDANGKVVYRVAGIQPTANWEAMLEAARTGVPPTGQSASGTSSAAN